MAYKKLAEKLIAAKSESQRKHLLRENPQADILKLAYALKDTYYKSWTSDPAQVKKASNALRFLVKLTADIEINALACWVLGISFLTKGKLDSAIESLDEAAEIFRKVGKEHESARTQVAKLYALALLGKYDEAVECGKNALVIFERYRDEIEAGKVENNLGNIVSRQEQHQKAEVYYKSARARFSKSNDLTQLVMSENGLAITYSALNDFRKAEVFFELALDHSKKAQLFVREAEIEATIGKLAMFRGNFDQALLCLENSKRKYEQLNMPHQVGISELEMADIYLELNLTTEAYEIYEKVSNSFSKLKMQGEEARSRANFGRTAILLNDKKNASKQLAKAAKLFVAENNLVGASAVKLSEAQLELSEGRFSKALKIASNADDLLERTSNQQFKLISNIIKAECFRGLGDAVHAKGILEKTYVDATEQENRQLAQTAQILFGKLAISLGDFASGEVHFKKAVQLIESLRSPLPAEEFRMAFLADKLVPYQELAKICLRENRIAEAFEHVESYRSRSLAETLGIEDTIEFTDEITAELQNKLQDLREKLNWFYSRLNRADEAESGAFEAEIRDCEREIAEIYRKINARSNTTFGNQKSFDLQKLQGQIGKQKCLVEFVGFEGEISAFIVTDSDIKYVENIAVEKEIVGFLEGLQFQFGALRYGAKKLGNLSVELKKRAEVYLQKLYESLLKPIEADFGLRDLIIVPNRSLHYVPFQALHDGNFYVIEKREVSFAASATVLQFCLDKSDRKLESAFLIGFADENIPLVNSEIGMIGEIFKENVSMINQDANFANFKKYAEKADILHIACHGRFRPDDPMFSSLQLADGLITVRDACAMKLSAQIVTLSACETGLNSIYAGDELIGLSRGFLSAGASSLVLSLWTVNDKSTGELMQIFYRELKKGHSCAEALRTAQRTLIERDFHPYFWSPFILIGKT